MREMRGEDRRQRGRVPSYLAVSADFDWFIVIPGILEVLTHVEIQTTPSGGGGGRQDKR